MVARHIKTMTLPANTFQDNRQMAQENRLSDLNERHSTNMNFESTTVCNLDILYKVTVKVVEMQYWFNS
jgi:hypothetical protein